VLGGPCVQSSEDVPACEVKLATVPTQPETPKMETPAFGTIDGGVSTLAPPPM